MKEILNEDRGNREEIGRCGRLTNGIQGWQRWCPGLVQAEDEGPCEEEVVLPSPSRRALCSPDMLGGPTGPVNGVYCNTGGRLC